MAKQPTKQLRWDRIIMVLLLLGGVGVGVYFLMAKYA
jgi:hypothetical protein